jgi:hypothetical protein
MVGLLVLILVPLSHVAFAFVLFLKERDRVFALATALFGGPRFSCECLAHRLNLKALGSVVGQLVP